MGKPWTDKLAKKEFERAKEWTRNIRLEGEEVPPVIILLIDTPQGRQIPTILQIPETVLSGGGASISEFVRFLIGRAKPSYLILLLEAWMVQHRLGTSQEQAQTPPSEHPDRVETIIALFSSPHFEIMASSPIIGGIPQDWQEHSGFEGRFSKMYGIQWGEA
jgi:hypothetical protein